MRPATTITSMTCERLGETETGDRKATGVLLIGVRRNGNLRAPALVHGAWERALPDEDDDEEGLGLETTSAARHGETDERTGFARSGMEEQTCS